ncbi:MAG: hypothetical protein SGJ00_05280 [bacterium]|nr:hypothetical protein [bacterium]
MKKTLIFSLLFLLYCLPSFAQKRGDHDITTPYAEIKEPNGEITQINKAPKFVGNVQGVVGTVYGASELNNLPTRSINKISGMTMGVQNINGQEPIFKGAIGGTAYFVDGIRVRSGEIGVAGFTY